MGAFNAHPLNPFNPRLNAVSIVVPPLDPIRSQLLTPWPASGAASRLWLSCENGRYGLRTARFDVDDLVVVIDGNLEAAKVVTAKHAVYIQRSHHTQLSDCDGNILQPSSADLQAVESTGSDRNSP